MRARFRADALAKTGGRFAVPGWHHGDRSRPGEPRSGAPSHLAQIGQTLVRGCLTARSIAPKLPASRAERKSSGSEVAHYAESGQARASGRSKRKFGGAADDCVSSSATVGEGVR